MTPPSAQRGRTIYEVLLKDGRIIEVSYREWLRWEQSMRRVRVEADDA